MPRPPVVNPAAASRAQLFSQLAALERAGMPLLQALATLQLPTQLAPAMVHWQRQLERGRELASAGQLCGLLTPLDASLIRAAQASGCLATLLQSLAERYEHQARQQAALRSRLLMPLVVLLLALFIQPLPALVGGQLTPGGYLWRCLQPLFGLALLYGVGRWLWRRNERASEGQGALLGALLARLPLLGDFYQRRNLRDFFATLGLLLDAGLPMLDALPRACATLRSRPLRRALEGLGPRIQAGQSLAQALAPLAFPGKAVVQGLISTGEASGSLPASLQRYARGETERLDSRLEQLALWLPRLFYAAVLLWMAQGMLGSGAFNPPALP
jgi:general secretion pathway protein F